MSETQTSLRAERRSRLLASLGFFAMYLVTLGWMCYFASRHDLVLAALCFIFCAAKALEK